MVVMLNGFELLKSGSSPGTARAGCSKSRDNHPPWTLNDCGLGSGGKAVRSTQIQDATHLGDNLVWPLAVRPTSRILYLSSRSFGTIWAPSQFLLWTTPSTTTD